LLHHQFFRKRHLGLLEIVQRHAKEELNRIVRGLGTVDDDLAWDHRILGMQQQGLLRRNVPALLEAVVAIARAELPE
jgi:transcriptional regulator of NAD metabolism